MLFGPSQFALSGLVFCGGDLKVPHYLTVLVLDSVAFLASIQTNVSRRRFPYAQDESDNPQFTLVLISRWGTSIVAAIGVGCGLQLFGSRRQLQRQYQLPGPRLCLGVRPWRKL